MVGCAPEQPGSVAGRVTMPADGHAIPFIALQDGKFNVTEEAAAFLQSVRFRVQGSGLSMKMPLRSSSPCAHPLNF